MKIKTKQHEMWAQQTLGNDGQRMMHKIDLNKMMTKNGMRRNWNSFVGLEWDKR